MSLLNLFKRRTQDVFYTRVLVCSLSTASESELISDFDIYSRHFGSVKLERFTDADQLMRALTDKYDIVHILAPVSSDGHIAGSQITGTELIEKSAGWGTKLLWLASSNEPQGYIHGWKVKDNKLNVVMTIDRGEHRLPNFLEKLLTQMHTGASMPVAWNRIAPQIPGKPHPDAPATIFYSGLGQVRFL